MKKFFAVIAVMAMSLSVLTGCGREHEVDIPALPPVEYVAPADTSAEVPVEDDDEIDSWDDIDDDIDDELEEAIEELEDTYEDLEDRLEDLAFDMELEDDEKLIAAYAEEYADILAEMKNINLDIMHAYEAVYGELFEGELSKEYKEAYAEAMAEYEEAYNEAMDEYAQAYEEALAAYGDLLNRGK